MRRAKTCAVTGASGFIGCYLVPELTARGWQVVPMGRDSVDFADVRKLASFLAHYGVTHVVHLAAESNPVTGDIWGFYEGNAFLTERLLMAAETVGLTGRFVHVSASSVYGDGGADALTEQAPRRPQNHYGASKLLAEVMVDWHRNRLDITIARPSNCIGLRQKVDYVVPKLVAAFAAKQSEIVMGDVEIARDFVDVRDAVDILVRALEAPEPLPLINVASGRPTQIRSILDALAKLTGHQPRIRQEDQLIRKGDIRQQFCNIALALALGHVPRYRLDATLSWMLSEYSMTPFGFKTRLP